MVSNEKLHHHILFPPSFQPIDIMEIAFFSIFFLLFSILQLFTRQISKQSIHLRRYN